MRQYNSIFIYDPSLRKCFSMYSKNRAYMFKPTNHTHTKQVHVKTTKPKSKINNPIFSQFWGGIKHTHNYIVLCICEAYIHLVLFEVLSICLRSFTCLKRNSYWLLCFPLIFETYSFVCVYAQSTAKLREIEPYTRTKAEIK